jgi:DNA/RNA endonuclease YhcR with UshA esterase domain
MNTKLSLTIWRWVALALAACGLLALHQAALARTLPVTAIARLDPELHGATLRVLGRVTRPPDYGAQTHALYFWVDDGSGELRVAVYGAVTQALIAAGHMPQAGDRVDLAGSLRVRASDGSMTLVLQAPAGLSVTRPPARPAALGELSADDALARVAVRARVSAAWQPAAGLQLFALRDPGGRIELVVPSEALASGGALPALRPGDSVAVTATVTLYKDEPQLTLGDARDLVLLPPGSVTPPAVAPGALGPADVGRWVRVEGALADPRAFNGGMRYALDDVPLVLWNNVYSGTLAAGTRVAVLAVVSEYRGRIELQPELPDDVVVLAAAAPDETPPPDASGTAPVPIAALVDGQAAMVSAAVLDASNFAGGFKFVLDDGTGRVVLLLWKDDYPHVPGVAGLRPGAQVRVTGKVQSYDGALELVPGAGRDVVVLAPGSGPQVTPRAIHEITGADVNTLQAIEGAVVNAKPFAGGVRVYVDDGSGSVAVVLWNAVWENLAGREALGPGARVRVLGLVSVYREHVELAPALPVYVEVR